VKVSYLTSKKTKTFLSYQTQRASKNLTNQSMTIKIENKSSTSLPRYTENLILQITDSVPKEHLRGLSKVVLVDRIQVDLPLRVNTNEPLPGLYHPKTVASPAWLEIATSALLPTDNLLKKFAGRLNYKANIAAILYSLLAQHYHLTFSYGVRKGRIEASVRNYTETYYKQWQEKQSGIRGRIFKPLRPLLEKWGKNLQKRYAEEKKKQRT
jgi:hypothetical protein